jgi:hypothetical protein
MLVAFTRWIAACVVFAVFSLACKSTTNHKDSATNLEAVPRTESPRTVWPLLPHAPIRFLANGSPSILEGGRDEMGDVLVAEPTVDGRWPYGKVYLVSGKSGSVMHCWIEAVNPSGPMRGLGSGAWFGGDFDRDGSDDIAMWSSEQGHVWVASGRHGNILVNLHMPRGVAAAALRSGKDKQSSEDELLVLRPGAEGALEVWKRPFEQVRMVVPIPDVDGENATLAVHSTAAGGHVISWYVRADKHRVFLVSGPDFSHVRTVPADEADRHALAPLRDTVRRWPNGSRTVVSENTLVTEMPRTGKVEIRGEPIFVDPFSCDMLDLPSSPEEAPPPSLLSKTRLDLAAALGSGDLAALAQFADPKLGMWFWTTSGSVSQPTHRLDRTGKLTPNLHSDIQPYFNEHYLPKLAELLRSSELTFRMNSPAPVAEDKSFAIWRTRGHARAELAHTLRVQGESSELAKRVIAEPIDVQLDIRQRDRVRVYFSSRQGQVYVTHFVLDEAETD